MPIRKNELPMLPFHPHKFDCSLNISLLHFALFPSPIWHTLDLLSFRRSTNPFLPFQKKKKKKTRHEKKKKNASQPVLKLPFVEEKEKKTYQHLLMNCTLVPLPNQTANASRPAVPKGTLDHQLHLRRVERLLQKPLARCLS